MSKITQCIILAAGLGQRMKPLTDTLPKPLVVVKNKPIIDYAIDMALSHGINKIVVNTHYLSDKLETYLKPKGMIISHEPLLLDTGGGIKNALRYLDTEKPVFVLSGDSILVDAPHEKSLPALENAWDADTMDLLLSLQPLETMTLTPAVGDYKLVNGQPIRTPDHSGKYMWNSARILHPRLFKNTPDEPFSFLSLMDQAQKNGRLAAHIHKGDWHHLTTPQDVMAVNAGWNT
ncbi:MAG: nucleotidyltransferase family protein [Proteobacteria bacterium]|nr:nucleotidyltransferase family protein [Pseudomonadota bacterium]